MHSVLLRFLTFRSVPFRSIPSRPVSFRSGNTSQSVRRAEGAAGEIAFEDYGKRGKEILNWGGGYPAPFGIS